MTRDFSKPIKREAVLRSGGLCEATGVMYDLAPNTRCNVNLGEGFEFDHVLAFSNGGESTLENVLVVCKACHKFKTFHHDVPRAAKTKRMSDKANGIRGPKQKIASRRFRDWTDNTKHLERL